MDNELRKAIQLIKEGKKNEGKYILINLVKTEPNNEQAWLWLHVCVEVIDQKRHCLQQALRINPNNTNAKAQLERLTKVEQNISQLPEAKAKVNPPKAKKKKVTNWYLASCFSLLLVTFLGVAGFWLIQKLGFLNFSTTNNPSVSPQSMEGTGIPSNSNSVRPLIEFSKEDIKKSLLTPDDLTFSGLYDAGDWKTCLESQLLNGAFAVDHGNNARQIDTNVQVVITRFYTGQGCHENSFGDGAVQEGIYLFSSTKQAERFTEVAKIQEQKIPLVLYDIILAPWNQYEFWIMQSKETFEASILIVQKEEAVLIIFIFNGSKLVASDLTDVGIKALENITDIQNLPK